MVLARFFCFGKELEDCQGGSFVNVRRAFTNTPLTGWKRPHAQGKGAGKGRRPPPASRAVGGETGGVGAKPPRTFPRSRRRRGITMRPSGRSFFPLTGWPPLGGRGGVVFGGRKLGFFAQIFGVRRRHAEFLFLV